MLCWASGRKDRYANVERAGPYGNSLVGIEHCCCPLGGYAGGVMDAQCMYFRISSPHDHARQADGRSLLDMDGPELTSSNLSLSPQ
jgi:hypothetical protein